MKKTNDTGDQNLQAMLESLELPEVRMPAHQRRLRETLLASGHFAKEYAPLSAHPKTSGGIKMKPKVWKLVASLAVLFLVVGVYMTVFTAPGAVASLTLQVNPAVNLTLDGRNTVIEAEGLDAQGESLLAGLDVTGKEIPEALRAIAGALREAGLLENGRRIVIALHPVEGRLGEAELTTLAGAVRQALEGYLAEHGLPVDVVSVSLTTELADAARAAGLLPADYVDLVAAVGLPVAMRVLNLQQELGLDPARFKEEFGTIAASLLDMLEAGMTGDHALAILKGALAADPKLEELATITAAMIDLHKAGATPEDLMAIFILLEEQVAAGMERALLLEEITTIAAAKIDLLEAGVPAAAALAVLRAALQADPQLEELTTITAALIDLVEEGLSAKEALAKIEAAIKADPTLQSFDDLMEALEKEEDEADEDAETGGAQPNKAQGPHGPQPDKPQAEASGEEADRDAETDDKPQPANPHGPADTLGDETDEEN